MHSFALIGKNISNSKSKMIYEEILGKKINYSLLDYPDAISIPRLSDIMCIHHLVSVTAPYKESFNSQVIFDNKSVELLGVINCIKKDGDKLIGTNTDLLAFADIISKINFNKIYILGDGAMSKMIQFYFNQNQNQNQNKNKYDIYSRRANNLPLKTMDTEENSIIINTCLREYDLPLLNPSKSILWNMNYDVNYISAASNTYLDGLGLLKKQAEYALSFWNL